MIKILILLAVIGLSTTIGIFLSSNKKKRMQIFSELYEFNEQLILTLKFSRQTIDKIAEPYKFVPKILKGESLLKGSDADAVREYTENLGKTDAMSQVDYLTEKKAVLKKYKEESFTDYKKYSSLYVKIFFMLGVMMAVLLA
ncbi:MAG: stage III sporulation protein AB [Clostridia bacterium]|nr:stage III sporulation protein AB [Clostridia bacterium]